MVFDDTNQHIPPLGLAPARLTEHGVGFADPRGRTEEYLQMAARGSAGLILNQFQQLVRIRSPRGATIVRFHFNFPSSLRLTSRTLTRGSPSTPRSRWRVDLAMADLTTAAPLPRAWAIRPT